MTAALVLFTFADGPDKYWPLVFPGFIIGSSGAMLIYVSTKYASILSTDHSYLIGFHSIAIFRATPSSMAGTVGAMFNSGLQFSSAVGMAAVGSIQASVQEHRGGPSDYKGQCAGYDLMLACIGVAVLAVLVFYRADTAPEISTKSESCSEGPSTEKTSQG